MKFWDASAVVPLCFEQGGSTAVESIARDDPTLVVWWGTPVECVSALARFRRLDGLSAAEMQQTLALLERLRASWMEILPSGAVRDRAQALLQDHALRAADALQLAAALVWASDQPEDMVMVTLDERLAAAARKEGFVVEPWPLPPS